MNFKELLEDKSDIVEGTTCANCAFTKDQKTQDVSRSDLNSQGGTVPSTDKELADQKRADVITMPGTKYPAKKLWCSNSEVNQWVTERMCCNLWEAPGIIFSCNEDKNT